ncbi:glycosyl hydrolase [Agromyces luteolus]|uniref:Exo-alpha-(1->6)-L-arabinopyranosidase n=1 Tax=Agromyces luteolus TaxID=88373 RepID=A0A7C9LBL9_9MICO|nr:glycoside hydrolase family 3 C-terminal domain-containing protein [Agromyces luteolus]MUN05632.1 amidohydrolase family protein [Agromyces luteolus]GLK26174.1 glycosyl hydrolase [Agromyces luteolus]
MTDILQNGAAAAAVDPAAFATTPAADIVATLTTEEKAALTSGESFWTTKQVGPVPSIMLTDGPHGVRKQDDSADHLGMAASVPATCFPPAVALGSSFDPELLERVGVALGEESRAEGVGVLLGPGINIKRSPLCGRNFEYLSEDPLVSGVLGSALVRGVQSQGVGASLKHYAANNQEDDRMRVSADIDPRPLREIYLRGFQRVVEDEQPWTVMCSYNRVNGVPASQNPFLLTEVLRDEWGFDGLVVSDWGAVTDRVAALAAGLDLEMPANGGRSDAQVVAAVEAGELDASVLDTGARRAVELAQKAVAGADPDAAYDVDEHHALAREAAANSIVLLRNEGSLLPLAPEASVAVIGEFARTPRFQGGGSSHVNATRIDAALESIREVAGADAVTFAPGFTIDGSDAAGLADEAVAAASAADVAVLFLGLPASLESEGFDRRDIELPAAQLELVDRVLAANPNTVVVLSHGGVVRLAPFADRVPAILETWLLGQAGGSAVADVLYGAVNPSGRLTETVPVRLQDTPAWGNFPGEHGHVRYGEGLLVGYRWYDARELEVTYPFGHGLSYTTFEYGDAVVSSDDDGLLVRVPVTNTGDRDGAEVVQVYSSLPGSTVSRAPRELKGFAKVSLAAGERRDVEVRVRRTDLAYWDTRVDLWIVEGGEYTVEVGASSRDVRSVATVDVEADPVRIPLTIESTISEVMAHPVAGPIVGQALAAMAADLLGGGDPTGEATAEQPAETAGGLGLDAEGMMQMMGAMPIGRAAMFPGSAFDLEQIEQLIAVANAPMA